MAEYEYITDIQRDLNWGETFNMSIKAPITSKRRFLTLGEAQAFVDDTYNSATPGLVLTILSNYVKDVPPTYEEGHFVCVTDVYTNFTWESAVGKSEGDTYTPGAEGTDNVGVYYIKSVGDGTNPGELVKISGSGGSGEIIRKYPTLTAADEDIENLSNADLFVVYETEDKGLYYVVKIAIPNDDDVPLDIQDGESGEGDTYSEDEEISTGQFFTTFIKIASVEDPEIQRFNTLIDATTYATTAEDGILVSLMIENDPNGDSGIYYTYNGTLIKLGGCPHVNTAFELKSQADEFATTASLGTIVCVYGDPAPSNNGVYYVAEGDDGNVLIKVGGGGSNNFTENPINVRGVNIGEYNTGDTIPQGTLFEAIFNDMLHKKVDVNLVMPQALYETDVSVPEYVEVGSGLDLWLTLSMVDGYFESEDKDIYPDSEFDALNPNAVDGKLTASCIPPLYYWYMIDDIEPPEGSATTNNRIEITHWCETEASHNLKGLITHYHSLVTAKMNNGDVSEKHLDYSDVLTEPINFKSVYKGFYGYIPTRSAQDYENVFVDQASFSNFGVTWLDTDKDIYAGVEDEESGEWIMKSTDNAPTLVIALPEYFEIAGTKNCQGANVSLTKWRKLPGDITYTVTFDSAPTTTTQYNVYVMHNTQGIYYKQIKIRKKINN